MTENQLGDHGPHWAAFWLRLAVSGFCIGWAGWLFGRLGSNLGSWLFFFAEIPHAQVAMGEQVTGWILIFCALLVWLPVRWAALSAIAGLIALADAGAGVVGGGYAFSQWTIFAHALRWATPLALAAWILAGPGHPGIQTGAIVFLRIAVAAVFTTHGLEAIFRHPGFEDFIIGTLDSWLRIQLSEQQIYPVLMVIGIVDLGVAAAVLFGSWSWLFAWLAIWGLVTALARLTTFGLIVWPELLLRFPHFCVPLALWAWTRARKKSAPQDHAGASKEVIP